MTPPPMTPHFPFETPPGAERCSIDRPAKDRILELYRRLAPRRAALRARNWYYNRELLRYLRFVIGPGMRVLEIGCGDGALLAQLQPSRGLGIDFSPEMIQQAKKNLGDRPALEFRVADIEQTAFDEQFDFVVMSDLLGSLTDIQSALDNLRSACTQETRVVINYHGILWEPLLWACAKMGLKTPQPPQNWLAPADIDHFLTLCDFETVRRERRMLLPKYIPFLTPLLNDYAAHVPPINSLCMVHFLVVRKKDRAPARDLSTTILVPCRNEKGNIRAAIQRLPVLGSSQEIIFVDGHSTDGTVAEIEQVITENPRRNIRLLRQSGRGKGDAVRLGFAQAAGDVLMILDADLTVPPEDLPKFFNAIASGKGEFINGSRLVYPMEREAMRFLNILGNKFFSWALSWLLSQRLKDTLCGTKVLLRINYQKIVAARGFFGDFDPFGDFDLLFGAAKQNLKIIDVPVRYRQRVYGTTNIRRFRHGWLLLRMTLFAFWKLKRI